MNLLTVMIVAKIISSDPSGYTTGSGPTGGGPIIVTDAYERKLRDTNEYYPKPDTTLAICDNRIVLRSLKLNPICDYVLYKNLVMKYWRCYSVIKKDIISDNQCSITQLWKKKKNEKRISPLRKKEIIIIEDTDTEYRIKYNIDREISLIFDNYEKNIGYTNIPDIIKDFL